MKDQSIDRAAALDGPRCGDADPGRRTTVKVLAGAALAAAGMRPGFAADEGPTPGDFLVRDDDDAKTALKSSDLKVNEKQLVVYPQDPGSKTVKDGRRLNRIIVIKLDPKDLSPETAKIAADGVVAYSAVCVHQNCEVNGWSAKDKEFLCVCHYSKFSPLRFGEVTGGPAPRPLPSIPLKVDNGRLVIAGAFSAKPGGTAA